MTFHSQKYSASCSVSKDWEDNSCMVISQGKQCSGLPQAHFSHVSSLSLVSLGEKTASLLSGLSTTSCAGTRTRSGERWWSSKCKAAKTQKAYLFCSKIYPLEALKDSHLVERGSGKLSRSCVCICNHNALTKTYTYFKKPVLSH